MTTSSKTLEKSLMTLDEVLSLEVDMSTLGLGFEISNYIEQEETESFLGVQFVKTFSKAFDRILISSIDLSLLEDNLNELFEEYEVNVEINKSKLIGKSIKQYQIIINIFKDRELWEETHYDETH